MKRKKKIPAESKQNYIKGRMLPLKEANVVFALHTQLLLQLVVHTHNTAFVCLSLHSSSMHKRTLVSIELRKINK